MSGNSSPIPLLKGQFASKESMQGLFTYPLRVVTPVRLVALLLLAIAVVQYLAVWLSFIAHNVIINGNYVIYDTLASLNLGWLTGLRWSNSILWIQMLVGSHIALFLALPLFSLLYNSFPQVWIHERGLAVRYFNRWMMVPWHQIENIRVVSLSWSSQLILLFSVSEAYLTPLHRFYSLFFGVKPAKREGFIVTSNLKDFDGFIHDTTQRIIQARNLRSQPSSLPANSAADVIEDNYFAPALKMALDPRGALNDILNEHPLGLEDAMSGDLRGSRTDSDASLVAARYGVRTVSLVALAYLITGFLMIPVLQYKINPIGPALLAALPLAEWQIIPPFLSMIAGSFGLHDTNQRIRLLTPAIIAARAVLLLPIIFVLAARLGHLTPFFILLLGGFWMAGLTAVMFKRVHEAADTQSWVTAMMAPVMLNILILILATVFMA